MTAARYVTIWCDGRTEDGHDCGQYVEGDSAAGARKIAGAPGGGQWLVGLPNGRDLCPRHKDQRNDTTRWGAQP